MGKLCNALLRDGSTVDLIALAIVKVTGCKKNATFVTASTSSIPDVVDVQKQIRVGGLCRAVDVNCASIGGFTHLSCRKSDMPIFLIA